MSSSVKSSPLATNSTKSTTDGNDDEDEDEEEEEEDEEGDVFDEGTVQHGQHSIYSNEWFW